MRKLFVIVGLFFSLNVFSQDNQNLRNLELYILRNQYDSSITLANEILKTDSTQSFVLFRKIISVEI